MKNTTRLSITCMMCFVFSLFMSLSLQSQDGPLYPSDCDSEINLAYFEYEANGLTVTFYAVNALSFIGHRWDFDDGNGLNNYPSGQSQWTITYPGPGTYEVYHYHADYPCTATITLPITPPCTDNIFSIGTFCNFSDPLPCDPCEVEVNNYLDLCLINQDGFRIYELGLPAGVSGWTVNGVAQGGGACIALTPFDPMETYEVCATIIFYDVDGSTCDETVCTIIGDCGEMRRSENHHQTNAIDFDAFPNPTQSALNIKNPSPHLVYAQLFGMDGQQVKILNLPASSTQSLALHQLPSGIYTLQIFDGNGKTLHSKRIVVNK